MNLAVMSAEHMTIASYIMYMISGVFIIVAGVLFLALDIAKCWRMVSGGCMVRRRKRQKTGQAMLENKTVPVKSKCIPIEEISQSEVFAEEVPVQKTELLAYEEEKGTEVLDTTSLELLQDIVYISASDTFSHGMRSSAHS